MSNQLYESPRKQVKNERKIVEEVQLPSKKVLTPAGVGLRVTSSPHRNGNPDHIFYEVWLNWEGGTLRSSTLIHDEATRVAVAAFLEDLTGVDYYGTLSEILNKYDWHCA